MSTLLLHHSCFTNHQTPPGHPERPDRIVALEKVLANSEFDSLIRQEAPYGEVDHIAKVHPNSYIDSIRSAIPESGLVQLDGDTSVSSGSWEAAMRGVGASCMAVDEVASGSVHNAFCMIRPPGHHAETSKAMGFCLFANVAVAARYAQNKHSMDRVAIIDFDVHHGNGTQEIFWSDESVMYCSTHQEHIFPGTGAANETGDANTMVNAPLSANDGSNEFKEAMNNVILPRITEFSPDLIIISAGFDAHARDPLANINLGEEDFAWVTQKLLDIADEKCEGRVVSMLEGGYDLEGLSVSAAAHIRTLMATGPNNQPTAKSV